MPQPGELIHGKYRILQQLADGGMGTIYEARHEVLGTSVALKMLHSNLAKRPNLAARFLQEARVSATLRSPHIVQVLDVEQGPQGAILVMELLRGETLQALMDRQRRLDTATAVDFALQIIEGLEIAHHANVVHRDLKPDNVFVVPGSQGPLLKLLDFGIAKLRTSPEFDRGLTRPGVVMGTPEYMAPEQAFSADTVDPRADIYAMGVLLFEMLSGQRPVQGDDPKVIAQKVFSGHVTALSALLPALPMGLVSAVHRAMSPAPKGRFSSADEMRQALLPFSSSRTPSTSVLGPVSRSTPPAPTQPNHGPLPPHSHAYTPPLSAALSTGSPPPVYSTGAFASTAPLTPFTGSPVAPSAQPMTGSYSLPPGGSQSPAPVATGAALTPAPIVTPAPPAPTPTGPMNGWPPGDRPASNVPQTLPPETPAGPPGNAGAPGQGSPPAYGPPPGYGPAPGNAGAPGNATTARDPLPQALSGAPPTQSWSLGPGVAPTAPLNPLAGGQGTVAPNTVLPDGSYGSSGGQTAYGAGAYGGAPPGGTAVASVYNGGGGGGEYAPPIYAPTPTPAPRRGAPVGLVAVLAALAGGLLVVVVLALRGSGGDGASVSPVPTMTAPTVPTVTAMPGQPTAPTTLPPFPTAVPTMTTPPTAQPGNPGKPAVPRDGGVDDGGADAGDAGDAGRGPLGLPLPPFPSAIPSAIPTQIQIPLPQLPPFPF